MIAGRMTERVTLRAPSVEVDGFGAETTTWTDYRTVRAEVRWTSGSTRAEASELFQDVRLEVVVRSAHPVGDRWRLVFSGVEYNIAAVERNRVKGLLRLLCEKVNQ